MDIYILFLLYYSVLNLWLLGVMGMDKRRSVKRSWRVQEKTLWMLALAGGALGGWIGMKVFRHKTKHKAFAAGFPLLALLHVAGLGYLFSQFYL